MKFHHFSWILALVLSAGIAQAEEGVKWTYEGESGPDNWSSLSGEFAACAGSQQSPIDLTNALSAEVEDLALDWTVGPGTVVNNGHTIQINVAEGSAATLGQDSFDLLQFHFHHGSEHAIDGETAEMEAHFVHQSDSRLMVIGVMIEEGEENPLLAQIWPIIPGEKGGESVIEAELYLTGLLPEARSLFRYNGSLTTPPCSEIVSWVVLQEPVQASREQIDAFAELYAGNARPLQPAYRRFILSGN